jgi:hypothetical protein
MIEKRYSKVLVKQLVTTTEAEDWQRNVLVKMIQMEQNANEHPIITVHFR